MSGKAVSWAMEQQTGSPAAKLVLVKLADNANEQGFCWPSIELIVEHTELGQSTVYKHLQALEKTGLFHSFDHITEHGTILKAYQLHLPRWEEAIPRGGKRTSRIPPRGKSSLPHGNEIPADGKAIPSGGIPYKEEPSDEPSVEPSLNQEEARAPREAPPQGEVRNLFGEETQTPPKPAPRPNNRDRSAEELDAAFDAYNEAAERSGWALCQARSSLRINHLKRRLKEVGGLEGWKVFLANAEADDWCCGRVPPRDGRKPFFAYLDYLLREQVFTKLMETQHGDRSRAAQSSSDNGILASAARVAQRRAASGAS